MEVLHLPASTGKLLIPSDFNNAWELRRSLANSQNISLPTLNWILYLSSNFSFFAGKPSPGSLPWSMVFQPWQGGLPVGSTGKMGSKSSLYSSFTWLITEFLQNLCSFLHKMQILLHTEQSQGGQTSEKQSCSDYSILCAWPQPAIKVKVFQDSMDLLLDH